jgi:Zn-finger nucleic acid-binding protein
MKLVACPQCHAQYDLTGRPEGGTFDCRCGATLEARPPAAAADAAAERCSACGALARSGEEICTFCGSGIVPSADPGSLICPECFARNLDEARFCTACGVAFAPQPIPESERAEIDCPCCQRALAAREIGGLVVHECAKCHGLWAPQDRFRQLVERASEVARARLAVGDVPKPRVEGDNPSSSPVEYRRCPVCAALMARRNHQKKSGVIIDQCHEHGTWLDHQELERIAGFVLSGKAKRVSDAQAEQERAAAYEGARAASRRMESPTGHASRDRSTTSEYDLYTGDLGSSMQSIVGLLRTLLD